MKCAQRWYLRAHGSLKAEQNLLVDFATFPSKVVDLLETCIRESAMRAPRCAAASNHITSNIIRTLDYTICNGLASLAFSTSQRWTDEFDGPHSTFLGTLPFVVCPPQLVPVSQVPSMHPRHQQRGDPRHCRSQRLQVPLTSVVKVEARHQ